MSRTFKDNKLLTIKKMPDRFFRQSLIWLLLSAVAIACIGRYTNIDLALSDWMYDPASRSFPWRDKWFAAVVVHQWAKYFFIAIGIALAGMLIIDTAFSTGYFDRVARRKLLVVILSAVIVPLVVNLLKSQSMHHCPWDVERYGGFAPYLRLFDQLPPGVAAGHCFPAGHASSALWLASFAVFWLPGRPRAAVIVFIMGLLPGLLLGWAQQMRGAHFLTHTLWSAWIASAIIILLARYVPLRTEAPLHRPASV